MPYGRYRRQPRSSEQKEFGARGVDLNAIRAALISGGRGALESNGPDGTHRLFAVDLT